MYYLHSFQPYLEMLSIESARIYDLDARPARIREWYELENMQTYYQLFCHFLIIIF